MNREEKQEQNQNEKSEKQRLKDKMKNLDTLSLEEVEELRSTLTRDVLRTQDIIRWKDFFAIGMPFMLVSLLVSALIAGVAGSLFPLAFGVALPCVGVAALRVKYSIQYANSKRKLKKVMSRYDQLFQHQIDAQIDELDSKEILNQSDVNLISKLYERLYQEAHIYQRQADNAKRPYFYPAFVSLTSPYSSERCKEAVAADQNSKYRYARQSMLDLKEIRETKVDMNDDFGL